MISSPHNESIKQVRKLAHRRERAKLGLFVAEGEDLIKAATAAKWQPVSLLAAPGAGLDRATEVEPQLLAAISTLGSGTRAIGVYEQRFRTPAGPLCVYLHEVSDPGNVGTILRSAAAFGVDSVVIGDGSADPYSPKAVRASMGAVFSVPIARATGVRDLPGERLALVVDGGQPLPGQLADALTVIVGSERAGLPPDVLEQCDRLITIPTSIDSLNAAMATTVALYELTRHRMAAP
jgi:TrmH family RNA methyltransferase